MVVTIEPLRVVFVRAYYAGQNDAVIEAISELGQELTRRGMRASVLCLAEGGAGVQMPLHTMPLEPRSRWWQSKSRARDQLYFAGAAAFWLWRHRRDYDVVVTVDTPTGIGFAGRAIVLLTDRRVAHLHWVLDLFYTQRLLLEPKLSSVWLRARRALELAALRGRSPVVVLGNCVERVLRQEGVTSPVHVIPFWAADSTVLASSPSAHERQPFTVFYGGHAAHRNPLGPILAAADLLPEVNFHLVATGEEVDLLRARLSERDRSNVLLEDKLPRDVYLAAACDADAHIVSLSRLATGTSVPSKTYAAMAMGRPVVYMGEPSGQAASDVIDANAGVVVDVDSGALGSAIQDLRNDVESSRRMGENGVAYVRTRRSVAVAGERWAELLRSLAARCPEKTQHL